MAKKFSLETVLSLTDGITGPMKKAQASMTKFSKQIQKHFGGLGKDINKASKAIDKMAVGLVKRGVPAVAGAATAIGFVAKGFIDAGAEAEKYLTVLTTMLGSQELANQRFKEMSQFAASTPFELNEVVQLGNQLQALGRYSIENMTILGDLAAAAGKPIDQVTSAFAKLASGQKGVAVDMFRDLLITTDDWVEATGKGISKSGQLMATTDQMIAALPSILGKKGFTGMMDNLSKSYEGMSSNFQDTITRFKQGMGTALLPASKKLMAALTKSMGNFADTIMTRGAGAIDKISEMIDKAADWIATLDFGKILDDAAAFIDKAVKLADVLAPLGPYILIIAAAIKVASAALAVYNVIEKANSTTTIIMAIIAAIGAVIVIIKLLIDNWDAVSAAGVAAFNFMKEGIIGVGATILDFILTPLELVLRLIAKIPGMSDKLAPVLGFFDSINEKSLIGGIEKSIEVAAKPDSWLRSTSAAAAPAMGVTYAEPSTFASESRSYSETRSTSEVFVRPDRGAAVSATRGGAPSPSLSYGNLQ